MNATNIRSKPKLIGDLLDIIHNAVIVINSQNRIVYANSRTAVMFRTSVAELQDNDIFHLFMPDDTEIMVSNILHITRNEREFEGEAMLRRMDGSSFMGLISGTSFQWDENHDGIAFSIHDITDMKAIERSLRHSERMAFLGNLTDDISHQIRNPIMVIGGFAKRLEELSGIEHDQKLYAASVVLEEWITAGFHPVVFCRFITTANYLGEHLAPILQQRFKHIDIQVVTSEDPDEVRKERIEKMPLDRPRVLIATDCLSEGINLQERFTAVLHYDLPWNPNRLEQREGRVDRFGQRATEVKACLLYGADNPIDGIVLDVLLRKVREIKKATGINVPFPDDSQSIIDTITQSLLLNPDRKIQTHQTRQQGTLFDFSEFGEAAAAKENVSRKIDEAAEREKVSRSIFAQNAIKAQEIEEDLRAVDEAIGDPHAVRDFVTGTLSALLGVQVTEEKKGYGIVTGNLPPQLIGLLPAGHLIRISFESPTPEGYHYLGRNHRFVEQLCQFVMANTVAREGKRAARAAAIRSRQVTTKSTLLLFRCRNVIEQGKGGHQIVAEEMMLWGWKGAPSEREFIGHEEAKRLLREARASSNLSPQARENFLDNELRLLNDLNQEFSVLAEEQSKRLVAAHERFSALMQKQRYQVVYPVLPMDLMGIYILLPEGEA